MTYALYQYMTCMGTVSHALVNIKSKKVYKALPSPKTGALIWHKLSVRSESIWETIQNDKHHKVVATAAHPGYITPRS